MTAEQSTDLARSMTAGFAAGDYPHPVEMAAEHVMAPGYDFGDEFAYGLGLILDGLERAVGLTAGA